MLTSLGQQICIMPTASGIICIIVTSNFFSIITIATDDPAEWVSISLFATQATVLTFSPDGTTSMQPLLHCCSHVLNFKPGLLFLMYFAVPPMAVSYRVFRLFV